MMQNSFINTCLKHLGGRRYVGFGLVVMGLFVFLICPISFVFLKSFVVGGQWSLAYFEILFQNDLLLESIVNSVWLASIVTVGCGAVSLPLALLFARYHFRGKGLLQGLLLLPIIFPPFVGALGVKKFLSQYGTLNLVLMKLGVATSPIDFLGDTGFSGVVVMQILHLYPVMFLNLVAAFSSIHGSLEEAASSLGASKRHILTTVLLPLVRPGLLAGAAIVFIWSLTDLGTPLMFNCRSILTVQIFNLVNDLNENPMGFALVVALIVMTVTFFLISRWGTGLKTKYEMTIQALKAHKLKTISSKRLVVVYSFVLGVLAIALLPHVGIALYSLSSRWGMSVFPDHWTLANYPVLFSYPISTDSIRMSVVLSTLSMGVDIVVGWLVAYLLVRSKVAGKVFLEALVMLPLGLPGIVLAFGYVATFSDTVLDPRANPVILLVISYAIRRLPFMVRSLVAGFQQNPVAFEEASHSLGAGPIRTTLKITMPLMGAHILAGAVLCFAYAMLEVSSSMILAMKESYYPMTKAIYLLLSLSSELASAMGVIGIVILGSALFLASRLLGKSIGNIFRVG